MFFFPITKKSRQRYATARELYAAAMAQARRPVFYADLAVPDTFDGRFELVSLHAGLMVRSLAKKGGENRKLAQALFDEMFLNLELVCREIGVGDLAVPRHIKRMMTALKGRALTYEEALNNQALPEALARNLYGTIERPADDILAAMAAYVAALQSSLAAQSLENGAVVFPSVDLSGVTKNGPNSKAA